MKLTGKDYEKIEAVMDCFDFNDAQQIISLWITNAPDGHYIRKISIPSVEELKDVGRNLLKDVLEHKLYYAGTRFLKAYKISWEDDDYTLGLTLDLIDSVVEPGDLDSEYDED